MLSIPTLNKKESKALDEFQKKLIKTLGEDLLLIKLFGSKATGTSHQESDIDILIVTKEPIRLSHKKSDIIAEIELDILLKYGVYISPVLYSIKEYKDFSNLPTNFFYHVNKEGINLWKKKEKILKS